MDPSSCELVKADMMIACPCFQISSLSNSCLRSVVQVI